MNQNLNAEGLQAKIGEKTEAIFNQEFLIKQNFVFTIHLRQENILIIMLKYFITILFIF